MTPKGNEYGDGVRPGRGGGGGYCCRMWRKSRGHSTDSFPSKTLSEVAHKKYSEI